MWLHLISCLGGSHIERCKSLDRTINFFLDLDYIYGISQFTTIFSKCRFCLVRRELCVWEALYYPTEPKKWIWTEPFYQYRGIWNAIIIGPYPPINELMFKRINHSPIQNTGDPIVCIGNDVTRVTSVLTWQHRNSCHFLVQISRWAWLLRENRGSQSSLDDG